MSKQGRTGHRTAQDAQARGLRDQDASVQVVGFASDDGPRPFAGGDFPQIQVPKDLDPAQVYRKAREDNALALLDYNVVSYGEVLDEIDVRDARFLMLFIRYYPGTSDVENAASVLAIIPEATLPLAVPGGATQSEQTQGASRYWYPIGVVDPFLRGAQPIVDGYQSVAPTWMAYRNMYAAQLNFTALCFSTNPTSGQLAPQMCIQFDTAQHTVMRFRVGVANIDPDGAAASPKYTYIVPNDANVELYYLLSR